MIPTPPKLAIVVRPDGTVEDVAILAKEPVGRAAGVDLLARIRTQIDAFERSVREQVAHPTEYDS